LYAILRILDTFLRMSSASLVVLGDIVTSAPQQPRATALAIADGRIVAVGDRDAALAAVAPGTPELALQGTVAPGFIDSHVHMLWGGRDAERIDVSDARSVRELVQTIAAYAAAHPELEWLAGSAAVDRETLAEGRFPTLAELDEAAGGRPLFLDRRAHDAFANSEGLRRAGIDDATPDPAGGVIARDASGAATGFLVERPAAELVERAMPAPTAADRARWLEAIQRDFLRWGVTSCVDPALTPAEMLAYQAAADAGRLTVRTTIMPLGDGEIDPAEMAAAFTAAGVDLRRHDDVLRVGPWKLFLDGGGSLGTALLYEPWPGTDGYLGNQTTSTEGLRAYARHGATSGMGLGVHCVGSAAIDLCLDAYAAGGELTDRGLGELGFHLIHAYLWPSAAAMARTRELGVLVATQAPLQWDFGPALVRHFGVEGAGRAHPFRSWLDAGCTVGGGSDGPGGETRISPLFGMWQMRTRMIRGFDEPVGPQEAVTAQEALMLYTTGAAALSRAPERGRLAVGAPADLVAIDVDPLTDDLDALRTAAVTTTMVGGEVVFEA
jgi:predicted amidohydrolase YtcJ